jgi:predicted DCC family thiol-disulfide oxidoreductase YuxK
MSRALISHLDRDRKRTLASRAHEFVLAYDADCGPCSRFKGVVELFDARRRMGFVSLRSAESSGLLADIAPASRYSSFHLIRPASGAARDDVTWSGSEALLPLIRLLSPWGRATSRIIEGTPGGVTAVSFAYSMLARLHRACSLEPKGELPT